MNTKDIYVGRLGRIRKNYIQPNSRREIVKTSQYTIFEDYGSYGIDVFTGKKYYIWRKCKYDDIVDLVNGLAIQSFKPIEPYLKKVDSTVTKEELRSIYNEFNNITTTEHEEPIKYPKDLVLKCVLETCIFLKSLNIEDEAKSDYERLLNELSDNYIQELLEFKNKKFSESNIEVSEYTIRKKYLLQVLSIEYDMHHLANINTDDLSNDLNLLQKSIRNLK